MHSLRNLEGQSGQRNAPDESGLRKLDHSFTQAVTDWYVANRRDLPWRADRDPYHVWVSEIMLQQTRVEAVRGYYLRWMEALPTIQSLAEAEEEQLLKLWQGLGYYNRVRNLKAAAREIMEQHGGVFPAEFDKIRALKGIGDYTAGAIASNCFDQPTPAVDGNVLRVMSRINADYSDIKSEAAKKKVTAQLAGLYPKAGTGAGGAGSGSCGNFTQGLMEIGAVVCIPNGRPLCDVCPAAAWCRACAEGIQMELPVKAEKKARRVEERTVFILTCGDMKKESADTDQCVERVAVRKRPKTGLLANLYEFPNLLADLTADQALQQAEDWGCKPTGLTRSVKYTHIFSHVEWHMTAYYITCAACGGPGAAAPAGGETGFGENAGEQPKPGTLAAAAPGGFRWVTDAEMEAEVPLPSAFQYFFDNEID